MSNQFGPMLEVCFVDKRRASGQTDTSPVGTPANYMTENALDTRLAAAQGATYTAAVLRQMTTNDKIFALRNLDDSAGI